MASRLLRNPLPSPDTRLFGPLFVAKQLGFTPAAAAPRLDRKSTHRARSGVLQQPASARESSESACRLAMRGSSDRSRSARETGAVAAAGRAREVGAVLALAAPDSAQSTSERSSETIVVEAHSMISFGSDRPEITKWRQPARANSRICSRQSSGLPSRQYLAAASRKSRL